MKKKKLIAIIAIAVATLIVLAVALYFIITSLSKPKSVSVNSNDGKATFWLDIDNSNIVNATSNTVNGIEIAKFEYKDIELLITQLQQQDNYVSTYNFVDGDEQQFTQIIFNKDKYYYVVELDTKENVATVSSLFARVSTPDIFPFFNNSVDVSFSIDDSNIQGGTQTYTIEQINAHYNTPMQNNAIESYEHCKQFYSRIDSSLYIFDDNTQTIKVKLYSQTVLNNGTHYYDGYCVTITFTQQNSVVISLDLDTILKG